MSEKAAKPKDRVKLNVGTILQTAEGRPFIKQLNTVSHVLTMKDADIEFKGEAIVTLGYIGDCKSVELYKCPNGYFLFCNKLYTSTNWSAIGSSIEEVLSRLYDADIKKGLEQAIAESAVGG